MANYGVVGAGFSGAIIAEFLSKKGLNVDVYESRPHIAGNCFTERDEKTNILVHKYGPHIFHTDNKKAWDYVNKYVKFKPYTNRVKAISKNNIYSLPINLLTINQFFKKCFSPNEAKNFLKGISQKDIEEPNSFEEQALKFVGKDLYEAFFKGYTMKQWEINPKDLPASILKRLPIRFNYDDNYFNHKYQGMPENGYTEIVEKILDQKNISLLLNKAFQKEDRNKYEHIFYTGPIDKWFDYEYGRLPYRTLRFDKFYFDGDFQGNAVINYCDKEIPFTRITEHKHFSPWENHEKSICFKEYSSSCKESDTPYYPVRFAGKNEILEKYFLKAKNEQSVSFLGRLGTFRYLDMDVTVSEALKACELIEKSFIDNKKIPSFFIDV